MTGQQVADHGVYLGFMAFVGVLVVVASIAAVLDARRQRRSHR